MTSSIKEALEKALQKTNAQIAQAQAQQAAPSAQAPAIPDDWDDEGGAKQIVETSTNPLSLKEHNVQTQTATHAQQPAAEPPHYFKVTNNVSRITYDFVRDNPGLTRLQIIKALKEQGYSESSTGSLISQMTSQGMVRRVEDKLYAVLPEYVPVKSYKVLNRIRGNVDRRAKTGKKVAVTKTKRDNKPRKAAATTAPVAPPTETLVEKKASIPTSDSWTAADVVNKLTVLQARAVYDELKKIFGA